jgi:hypothetical protein
MHNDVTTLQVTLECGSGDITFYRKVSSESNYDSLEFHTDFARTVYACDLDGDGDNDVLSASSDDDKIAWYENLR